MPLLYLHTSDLGRIGLDSTLGPMIQVQCSTVHVLQGCPHSHISKTVLVQIRKGTHGKAKPSILGRFWLKCSLECQQGLLVEVRRWKDAELTVPTLQPVLKCMCLPFLPPSTPQQTSFKGSQQVSPGSPNTHKHVLFPYSGVPGTWGQPQVRHWLFHPHPYPMGKVHCQSMSQSGEWWVVITPEKWEGDYGQVGSTHWPANLVLTVLTDCANLNSAQAFQDSLAPSLFPQPGGPSGSKSPTLTWMPYLLPLEALGDPHSSIFLKLEGDDLSSMSKPRSP